MTHDSAEPNLTGCPTQIAARDQQGFVFGRSLGHISSPRTERIEANNIKLP
jgi:hypothetical protein